METTGFKEDEMEEKSVDAYIQNGIIRFSAINIEEFKEAINSAIELSEQLHKALRKLDCFDIEIKIE